MIGTIGLFLTAASVTLAALGIWANLERSRREFAINMLREWTVKQTEESNAVKQLAKKMTKEQCENLLERRPVHIPNTVEMRELLIDALSHRFDIKNCQLVIENNFIVLNGRQSQFIRFSVVNYLNLLESILSSWHDGAADSKRIADEFRFLHQKSNSLKNMRDASNTINGNIDSFPSITSYLEATTHQSPRKLKPLFHGEINNILFSRSVIEHISYMGHLYYISYDLNILCTFINRKIYFLYVKRGVFFLHSQEFNGWTERTKRGRLEAPKIRLERAIFALEVETKARMAPILGVTGRSWLVRWRPLDQKPSAEGATPCQGKSDEVSPWLISAIPLSGRQPNPGRPPAISAPQRTPSTAGRMSLRSAVSPLPT